MSTTPITKEGFAKLEKDLLHLRNKERPAVIQAIAEARIHGDLSENAEYHSAKDKQGFIESKIRDLAHKMAVSVVVDIKSSSDDKDKVKFGATVTLYDEDNNNEVTYKLIGEYEADIENGLLSIRSPLGCILINKKVGDYVELRTPKGKRVYSILKIEFK